MIINLDTADGSPLTHRPTYADTRFAAVLAQYATTPLFAPWSVADQNIRTNPAATSATLNTHAATSNRREGRHARG